MWIGLLFLEVLSLIHKAFTVLLPLLGNHGILSHYPVQNANGFLLTVSAEFGVISDEELLRLRLYDVPRRIAHGCGEPTLCPGPKDVRKLEWPMVEMMPFTHFLDRLAYGFKV